MITSKLCTTEDITVDALVAGNVVEVEDFDHKGKTKYVAGEFREPFDINLFCDNCGEHLDMTSDDINKAVAKHLADPKLRIEAR